MVWSTSRVSRDCTTHGPAQRTSMSLHMLVAVGFSLIQKNSRHQQNKVSIYFGKRKFSTILSLFPTAYMLWDRKSRPWCYVVSALFSVTLFMNMLISLLLQYVDIFPPESEVEGPFTLVTAKYQMAQIPLLLHLELYSSWQFKGQDFITAHRTLSADLSYAPPLPISMTLINDLIYSHTFHLMEIFLLPIKYWTTFNT